MFQRLAYHGAPLDPSDCISDHLGVKSAPGLLGLCFCVAHLHRTVFHGVEDLPSRHLGEKARATQLLRIVNGTSQARPVVEKPSSSWLKILTSYSRMLWTTRGRSAKFAKKITQRQLGSFLSDTPGRGGGLVGGPRRGCTWSTHQGMVKHPHAERLRQPRVC